MKSLNTRGAAFGSMRHFLLWNLGLAKPWTYHNKEELQCLEKYALNKKHLVELGVWHGISTCHIRRSMDKNGKLYAVDSYLRGRLGFNQAEIIAHREVKKVENGDVAWVKVDFESSASHIRSLDDKPFDFIFDDSLKTFEGAERVWKTWKPLLARDGIYIISTSRSREDLDIEREGSVRFTNDVLHHDSDLECLDKVGTFTVFRRK